MCTPQGIIEHLGCMVFNGALKEATKAGKYVCHYRRNLETLQTEMTFLEDRRTIIERKVKEAKDCSEVINEDVLHWQRDTDAMKDNVQELVGQSTGEARIHCFACSCPNVKWRYRLSIRAEEKIDKVKKLVQDSHFDEISHRRPPPRELEFPSNENYVNMDSRKPIFNNIVDALKDSDVNMIGVYGPGGVGKTTLVIEVGNKMGHDGYFKQVSLATIPKGLKVEAIQSQLAESLNFAFDPNEGSRAVQLWNKLADGDRYLIILDDIWEKVDFKAIGIPIADENKSCKVLLTSRDEDLLLIKMKVHCFKMVELPEKEAWDLFQKKVGNSFGSYTELDSVAHDVCKRCKGLPVAINAIGAALEGKSDFAWKDALVKLEKYELMNIEGVDSNVWASLKLSYDLLQSSNAKSIFLLCCLFREDAEIPIGELTRHCLARRLVSQNPRTLEEVGNSVRSVVGTLKSASLLSNGSHENVVRIHDIIRDVGISIAREEKKSFFVEHGALQWPQNPLDGPSYSAISLTSGKIKTLPNELVYPQLHTLMVENKLSYLDVPDNFFNGMTQLTVLTFTRMRMRQLPSSFAKLSNLRMLYLIKCNLADIAILRDLNKNLEVLSLRGSTIEALPPEIEQLINLRVLDLEDCMHLMVVPQGVISNLTSLEELYFPQQFSAWGAAIDEQKDTSSKRNVSLEELRWSLTNGQLTTLHIHIANDSLLPKEDLLFKNLKGFKISMGYSFGESHSLPAGTRVLKYEGSLRNEFIPLVVKAEVLYLLYIKDLKIKVFHNRDVGNEFLELKHLEVYNCDDDLEYFFGEPKSSVQSHGLHPLQSFNKLTVLIVKNCDQFKYLFSPTTARELVNLERLCVASCTNMEAIVGFEGQNDEIELVFNKMRQLKLENLPKLICFYAENETTATTMESSSARAQPFFNEKVVLPVLEEFKVYGLHIIEEIWDKQSHSVNEKTVSFCQLRTLELKDCYKLMNLVPSNILPQLQNLQRLLVRNCPLEFIVFKNEEEEEEASEEEEEEEEEASDGTLILPQLMSLEISNMKNLKSFYSSLATSNAQSLFNHQVAFPALEKLDIEEVHTIIGIWVQQPLSKPQKEAKSFCKLMSITLRGCYQLQYVLPSCILPQLQNLEKLFIKDCYELEVIVSNELKEKEATNNDIIVFPRLQDVTLWSLYNLKRLCTGMQLFLSDKDAFPVLEDDHITLDKNIEVLIPS